MTKKTDLPINDVDPRIMEALAILWVHVRRLDGRRKHVKEVEAAALHLKDVIGECNDTQIVLTADIARVREMLGLE